MPRPDSPSHQRSRSPRRSPSPEQDRPRRRSRSPRRRRSPRENSRERGPVSSSRRSRSREGSPPRQEKKQNYSKAFKWKSKGAGGGGEDSRDGRDSQGGYRGRNDEYRPQRYGGRDDRDRRREFNERDRDRDGDRRGDGRDDRDSRNGDRFGGRQDGGRRNDFGGPRDRQRPERTEEKKSARPAAAPATFILVTVNDRLGTKATIPCLGSDTVGDFKKLVAAHIGRQPHEIMLKRQGERPFKDNITLEDYGVSSGVQLDLELDTGD